MKLSIVIPCYNEERSIPLILDRFAQVIKRDDIEVIMVNNGSQDNSQDVLDSLLPKYQFAKGVKVEVNQGYGFGILDGLRSAIGDYLGWTHADMQTDPYDVIRGLELIEKSSRPEETFVKGSRHGRSLVDNFFTYGMSIFETLYLGVSLNDINAQPNLFHRSFFESWKNPPQDFSLDLYALYRARKQNLKVIRFSVFFKKRIYGHSHWNVDWKSKCRFIKRTIDFSFRLKKELR